MKVTVILPPDPVSGGVKVAIIHARALAQKGHAVEIVSSPFPPVPRYRQLKSWIKGYGWPVDHSRRKLQLDGSGIVHRVLERPRPVANDDVSDADVVIATWFETAEWVHKLDAKKGAKVYFIQHHEIFPWLPGDRCRATYRLPLHKVVVSRWLKETMRVEYGDDKVDVVPNSVDRTQFFADMRGKQSNPTVGLLFSSTPFKGLSVALAAVRKVRQRLPGLRVVSFGSERPRPGLDLPRYAEFHYCPPQDRIRNLYSRCDVWLSASRSEGFNLPAIEAMACRTPVVSTRTGWPEEAIVSGRNGLLVDVDDEDGLGRGLEWVLTRCDRAWKELSARAYETAVNGSWQESTELFERALMHACRRAANGEIAGSVLSDVRSGTGFAGIPARRLD
jgi:glycosyltransferase involved in cell wall biosynthesis